MNNDGTLKEEAGGLGDRIAGNVKDATGAITGNERLEREGEAQHPTAAARQRTTMCWAATPVLRPAEAVC
jgi:uncharacterized protein YjbJ (UPF0337 family)